MLSRLFCYRLALRWRQLFGSGSATFDPARPPDGHRDRILDSYGVEWLARELLADRLLYDAAADCHEVVILGFTSHNAIIVSHC